MFVLATTILVLGLAGLVIPSPILQARQNETTTDPSSIFKPDTLAAINAITELGGVDGGIVAYTSPKGDGVLTFGNRSEAGDPITPDVSPILASGRADH
jgi:hypothetical protein